MQSQPIVQRSAAQLTTEAETSSTQGDESRGATEGGRTVVEARRRELIANYLKGAIAKL
ncbi:MAG: hypothetical protein AAGL17_08900 [Cyanobacteria bacterium J06576_12]